jgi:hypothetical protein
MLKVDMLSLDQYSAINRPLLTSSHAVSLIRYYRVASGGRFVAKSVYRPKPQF